MRYKIFLFRYVLPPVTVVGLLLIGLTNPAFASTWRGQALIGEWQSAPWRIGPFRIRPQLVLNNAGYDSNIFGSALDPVKDYSFNAGPDFKIYFPFGKKLLFALTESPQYIFFLKTANERAWNNSISGQVSFLLNKFLLAFDAGHSNVKQRLNTEIIEIRPRVKTDILGATILWQRSSRTSFSLTWNRMKYYFEDYATFALSAQLNRMETRLGISGYYELSKRTRYSLNFEYGLYGFSNPKSKLDSSSFTVFGGIAFTPPGKIGGHINLGYRRFYPYSVELKSYGGFIGDVGISIRLKRYWSVRALYRRDFPFSYVYQNTYYIMNWYQIGTSIYVFKSIRFDFDYIHAQNTYPDQRHMTNADSPQPNSLSPEGRYDSYSTGLFFRLIKNIGVGVTAGRTTQGIASSSWGYYGRDYVFLSLTYDF